MNNGSIQKFYDIDSLKYRNVLYALDIAVETYFADFLLGGEVSRLVYCKNDFAFRKRAEYKSVADAKKLHNLDFPFMNYCVTDISADTERQWYNHELNLNGVYVEELGRNIRMIPVTVKYESTIFFHTNIDSQFAMAELLWDADAESIVNPIVEIDGQEVSLHGVLDFGLSYEPQFDRNDWLAQNKIHSIGLDFEVQTFLIKDSSVCVPKELIFSFFTEKEIAFDEDNLTERVTTYFNP
jgi:hypothetical protein